MFYLLRHGQTDWNAQARLQGTTDIPLNEAGREQARVAGAAFVGHGITRIYSSPLSRALETAQIVGEALSLTPDIDVRLVERNFGLFEGMTINEVAQMREEMGPRINPEADRDGKHYPLDAEPLDDVILRVKQCLEAHLTSQDVCLFVTHGIPFRVVTRLYLGAMHSSPNAAPVRIEPLDSTWRMVALDDNNPPIHASVFDGPTTMGRL